MKKLAGNKWTTIKENFLDLAKYCQENKVDFDQYGNGKFLNAFEEQMAEFTGMEAGLFMPSGVMAQLIAIRIYSDEAKNKNFACHPTCHLLLHEEDSYKELHNLEAQECGDKDAVTTLEDIKNLKKVSSLILELPLRHLGGDLPTWDELETQKIYCKEQDIKLHLDGARICETQNYYQKSVKEIAAGFDSLFLSFYKGIGSTSGSMLLGKKDFIEKAKVWLRRHGGNLFQLYPLAVSAKMNFDKNINYFEAYSKRAVEMSKILKTIPGIKVIPGTPKTNMMHLEVPQTKKLLHARMKKSNQRGFNIGMGVWREDPPGTSRLEIAVGDATAELSDQEIKEAFEFLLKK
jgi:threonine aldolase